MITIEELYKIYLQYPSVQTDTRKLQKGDIFFALKGPNFDGNTYALKALEQGAAYAIVDDATLIGSDRLLFVADVLSALQQLAHYHRLQLDIPFIAITGSNGKTTTKELMTSVLRKKYNTYATIGNLNNHIGVPLTLLKIRQDAEIAVVEMGANHLQEIASYCKIVAPTHGIITNCGKAHIEGFGSEEGVRKGKGELYDAIRDSDGVVFRNTDLAYLEDMAAGIRRQYLYGSHGEDVAGTPASDGVLLQVAINKPEVASIATNLVGAYNFPNVMTAVAVGLYFEVSMEDITAAIAEYSPDNSRSQLLERGSNKIILDAYNANPTSMKAAIENFATADLSNKVLYLGAMKEMGITSVAEHTALVAMIQQYQWQDVVLVGKEYEGLNAGYKLFADSAAAKEYVQGAGKPQYANVLIKGSRGSKMEVILDGL